ncbi:cory-CC-star protein [Siminovitchia sp. FSL H7-0308]|uniref:N-formylglutamate amidohydrolase n=1 Tax=Siminovitchia thermophila TaxID=1245522 RepID=A0ABS2RBN5_9BACI|nr:cory-CC-star protein [Siminovitchia thermophila]MBM7717070.1 N-formylglutamate amidohydrolase [Siminovitchia thermophila]ONK25136.1 hypothetical protein BLX87_01430 [Bacillus sp. VT-16-64]
MNIHVEKLKSVLKEIKHFYREMYYVPYRQTMQREIQRRDDMFKLLVMSEMLGLPNPASFYTLELMPFMLEDFHKWHTRMGMEKSPLEGFRCC